MLVEVTSAGCRLGGADDVCGTGSMAPSVKIGVMLVGGIPIGFVLTFQNLEPRVEFEELGVVPLEPFAVYKVGRGSFGASSRGWEG